VSIVRRNIIANLIGTVWISVLTLAITPLQVNLLGIASYGLLGFISTLQLLFTGLDFGLSSTLTRELAADHSPDRTHSVPLVRTAATVYWIFALVVGILMLALSGAIARRWFDSKEIDRAVLAHALRVIALYLALRWPVALYTGILSGLQRMEVLNVAKVSTASLRLIGGILVLLLGGNLQGFLWWIAVNALVEVITYALVCRVVYPALGWRPAISARAIKAVWRYSVSMNALALLAIVVVQLDRLMISKMLPLEALGYYSLAYSAAAGIVVFITSISSAALPSFAAAHSRSTADVLMQKYDNANRAALFVAGSAAFALVFFGRPLLSLWVSPAAAAGAWKPLALLAAGFWVSAAVSNAYSIAVATGFPSLPLRVSSLCALPYALCLYWMIHAFGAAGAAGAWLAWNVANLFFLLPAVHKRLFGDAGPSWFRRTLLPFVALGCISFALPKMLIRSWSTTPAPAVEFAGLGAALLIYAVLGYFQLGATIRSDVRLLFGSVSRSVHGRRA
jgi:O-antigen/teichoic acid export membrane protein